jgi:molecular chaperone DnaK (HSP70)
MGDLNRSNRSQIFPPQNRFSLLKKSTPIRLELEWSDTDHRMLCFLVRLSLSAVFGVDFGSDTIKLAIGSPSHGVVVALNSFHHRRTPSVFSVFSVWNASSPGSALPARLSPSELRSLGWQYFTSSHRNHSITGVFPVLGRSHGLTRRETFALLLRRLLSTAEESRWSSEDGQIVISVDPFVSRPERIALAEGARLANTTLRAIIDSPTAAAQAYVLENLPTLSESPTREAFVSVGARGSWAAVFEFVIGGHGGTTPIATELSIAWNTSLGSEIIDFAIAEHIGRKVGRERSSHLVEEAKRAKEVLSNFESVDLDFDPPFTLTRLALQETVGEFNISLARLLKNALTDANLNVDDVSVRLLGGGTLPRFVAEIYGGSRVPDSDESGSIGAPYAAAALNSAFLVRPSRIVVFTNTNVTARINGREIKLF